MIILKKKPLNLLILILFIITKKKTEKEKIDIIKYNKVYNFCKKNKIPIYITNNFKLLLKLKADGIFITSKNICTRYPKIKNKKLIDDIFEWMDKVHTNWKDQVLPTRSFTKSSYSCKSCPVAKTCWKEMDDGDIEIEALAVK